MTDDPREVRSRDAEFVATVAQHSVLWQCVASLLLEEPARAHDVVDGVLARLYERRVPAGSLRIEALRSLVGGDARSASLPWQRPSRFELVESPTRPKTAPVVADLARLPRDQRAAAVLAFAAALHLEEVAAALDRPGGEAVDLVTDSHSALLAGHPERNHPARLTAELRAAVPPDLRAPRTGFADLTRGRRLIRRRGARRALSVAAALLVAVVLATQLWPRAEVVPSSAPPNTDLPSTPAATATTQPVCDTSESVCRATILSAWRTSMAAVVSDYVDPDDSYFTGFSFSYDDRYESPDIWSGRGALGLDLFRLQGGRTQIYVQVATSRREAVRCGTTTKNTCVSQRFMDGNRFILSETTDVAAGLEVQYAPNGDQVITVIARNRNRGEELPVERGDLIRLVQDPRLRLPVL